MAVITHIVDSIKLLDGTDLVTTVTYDEQRGNQEVNQLEIRVDGAPIARLSFRALVYWMCQQVVMAPMPPFIDVQGLSSAVLKIPEPEA